MSVIVVEAKGGNKLQKILDIDQIYLETLLDISRISAQGFLPSYLIATYVELLVSSQISQE